MNACLPLRFSRSVLRERGRAAGWAANLGQVRNAAGPPQGVRPLLGEGGREAARAASLGEVHS